MERMKIEITNYNDILNLFDSTDLSHKSLFEIITKYSNAVRKQPILIMAKDRDSLKRDLQSFIDAGCKGIILGVNPLL